MPIFNAEKFLPKAISSVINQSYENWELILINDASSDNSLKLCLEYANIDSRITVIDNDQNYGPAKTRNIGIENSKGEFISFIDSDDTIERKYLEILVNNAIKYEADVIWCQYTEIHKNGQKKLIKNSIKKNKTFNNNEAVKTIFSSEPGQGSLWNKLYRKKLIDTYNLRLNEKRVRAEDWEFNVEVFKKLKKLVCIEDSLYYYTKQNSNSIMATYRPKDLTLMYRTINILVDLAKTYSIKIPSNFFIKNLYGFIEYIIMGSKCDSVNAVDLIFSLRKHPSFQFVEKNSKIIKLPKSYILMYILIKSFPKMAIILGKKL